MDWLTLIIGLIIGFFVGREVWLDVKLFLTTLYYHAILKANRVIKEENNVW